MADCLSRWAYPASKGMTDVSAHGDEAETAEAKRIIEKERLMEEEGVKCFVVMAADAPLGTRTGRAVRVLAPDGAESDKHLFPESCLQDDWTDDYAKSSPSRSPLRPYPSSTPSPRRRRSRSPRHRHPRHHRRSTSSPRRTTTTGTDPSPPRAPAHLAWWSPPALQELCRWVKWAGGAGRHEGVHMVHTFEEVRTRTPANPNEAAPEAIMPQAAWEALLRDAVQGLRPPYTPQALRQWLQATHPQAWAAGVPSPPRPSCHHHTRMGQDKGKGRARGTKEHSGKRAGKGPK